MNIPASFNLHGQVISVVFVPDLLYKESAYGFAKYAENLIQLQPSTVDCPVPTEMMEETFCHEMVHHILLHVGGKYAEQLKNDEDFVDKFGKLLHQALTTQKGNLQYAASRQDNQGSGSKPE